MRLFEHVSLQVAVDHVRRGFNEVHCFLSTVLMDLVVTEVEFGQRGVALDLL
jgi:hypothetical protein